MVYLAIEELDADGYVLIFRNLFEPIQPGDAVGYGFVVARPPFISEERDEVWNAKLRCAVNASLEVLYNGVMVCLDVEPVADRPAAAIPHRANKPVFTGDSPFVLF